LIATPYLSHAYHAMPAAFDTTPLWGALLVVVSLLWGMAMM
jgi:hypothetical protein